jgi:hypothetical protein
MKTILRLLDKAWWLVVLAVVLWFASSCTTTQYVPVETVRTDSVRIVDVRRDSVYVMDSVIVKSKADTVYVTRWRTEYKEILKIDTLISERVDTVTVEKVVEKELTEWEALSIDVGNGVLWVAIIAAIGAIVWVIIRIAI